MGCLVSSHCLCLFSCYLEGIGDHLRDVPWKDIFKLSAYADANNFVSGSRLELIYISPIKSIRSSLTHLHGFQLPVLLP